MGKHEYTNDKHIEIPSLGQARNEHAHWRTFEELANLQWKGGFTEVMGLYDALKEGRKDSSWKEVREETKRVRLAKARSNRVANE